MTSHAGFRKDLFDCASEPGGLPRCLFVTCCMPCAFGSLVGKLDARSEVCCAGQACPSCFCYTLLGTDALLGWCYHCQVRKGVRKQTGLVPDEGLSECLTVCLCGPCALCQELNHLELCEHDPAPPAINPVGMQAPYPQQMAMQPMQQQAPQQQPIININVGGPPAGYPPYGGGAPQQGYGAPPPAGYPTY